MLKGKVGGGQMKEGRVCRYRERRVTPMDVLKGKVGEGTG